MTYAAKAVLCAVVWIAYVIVWRIMKPRKPPSGF